MTSKSHYPVMLPEVIEALKPQDNEIYVDGTFGVGGYTKAILDSANCIVYAIDRDPSAIKIAEEMALEYPDRLFPIHGEFSNIENLIEDKIDGFVIDIGVSSPQLDNRERGFSFQGDGPLDMRMDNSKGLTAADIINDYEEEEIANIIFKNGDERASRRIAGAIVRARLEKPFETTKELTTVIHKVIPRHHSQKTDPATKTFQALRIEVNDELGELDKALEASQNILKADGRFVVVAFHSLEDSRVKKFFKKCSGDVANSSRHMPELQAPKPASFKVTKRKGFTASEDEIKENPRSRSARLRYGIRTNNPAILDKENN